MDKEMVAIPPNVIFTTENCILSHDDVVIEFRLYDPLMLEVFRRHVKILHRHMHELDQFPYEEVAGFFKVEIAYRWTFVRYCEVFTSGITMNRQLDVLEIRLF